MDLKLFQPGHELQKGLVWVVEQMPGKQPGPALPCQSLHAADLLINPTLLWVVEQMPGKQAPLPCQPMHCMPLPPQWHNPTGRGQPEANCHL